MSSTSRLAIFSQLLGGLFASVALFGFFWMNFTSSGGLIPVFAIVTAGTLAFARQKGDAVLAVLSEIHRVLPDASPAVWLFAAVALGTTLRIFVATLFPPTPLGNWNADMVTYLDLAHRLVDGMDYVAPEGRANWPPGLPLVLALLLPVFG